MAAQKTQYVVKWNNRAGHETMYYPPYAANEHEALRKSGGVFCKLLGKDVHKSVMAHGEVYGEGTTEYKEHLADANRFKALYEKKRNHDRIKRGIKKIEKNVFPAPGFSHRTKTRSTKEKDTQQLQLF